MAVTNVKYGLQSVIGSRIAKAMKQKRTGVINHLHTRSKYLSYHPTNAPSGDGSIANAVNDLCFDATNKNVYVATALSSGAFTQINS